MKRVTSSQALSANPTSSAEASAASTEASTGSTEASAAPTAGRRDDAGSPMRFLRGTLRANAAFSTLSGLTFLIGGEALTGWLGRSTSVVPDGIILLVFAAWLLWLTRTPVVNLRRAMLVVALDAVFVVDAAVKIARGAFSPEGTWFFAGAAAVVALLAALQTFGIVRSRAAAAEGRARATGRAETAAG